MRSAGDGSLLQSDSDTERLQGTEDYGEIARPLRDLLAPQFAFLLQLRKWLIDNREQLQDDRGGDVGHDAQSKDG